ncbi:MAG: glycosyltransferase family 2 protein [Proteobacteria bacterium]|nr:glycosyltransferase family 2 protein [Pseudomonadota bacterium]
MTGINKPDPGTTIASVSDDKVRLSVIVPAYNEEELIEQTIGHLLATGKTCVEDLEIIIVNDGSHDRTPEIIDGMAEKHAAVRVFHQNPNRGFGATVRMGFEKATKDYVMVCPVDYQFTLEDFDIYLALIKHADIVIGYRRHRRENLPLYRYMVSTIYHLFVNILFRLNFFDVNWIHMYRRERLPLFMGQSDGVFLLAENLIRAKNHGLKIIGVDVSYIERAAGVATGIKPTTILTTVGELIAFFLKGRNG